MTRVRVFCFALTAALAIAGAPACKKKPPVSGPTTPPPSAFPGSTSPAPTTPPGDPGPPPIAPPVPTSSAPVTSSGIENKSVDDLNREALLKPVFFLYDSDQLDETARKVLETNAQTLKTYKTLAITIEGHCDERGSAEYNLALGDRRALAAKNYLLTLGVAGDRIKTVSYGKEFPFDPGHDENAFQQNRRAHFTVTAKDE
jgi:peptidoglycan-associated lipoprotein